MSAESRRRSSLCPNRISMLPSNIDNGTSNSNRKIADCILSALDSLNGEFMKSDDISLFPDTNGIVDNIENLCEDEVGSNSSSKPLNTELDTAVHYKEEKIASLNEERHKWEILVKQFHDQAGNSDKNKPNRTMEFEDVPDSIKHKAVECHYLTSSVPYDDILIKCQKTADKTFLIIEDCIAKAHRIHTIHKNLEKLVERQYEKFTSKLDDSLVNDTSVKQLLENRIAIVSPSNK